MGRYEQDLWVANPITLAHHNKVTVSALWPNRKPLGLIGPGYAQAPTYRRHFTGIVGWPPSDHQPQFPHGHRFQAIEPSETESHTYQNSKLPYKNDPIGPSEIQFASRILKVAGGIKVSGGITLS